MKRQIISQIQNEALILDRRKRIVRAAIKVFRRDGFHNATTKDIALEAGMTQSNLYNYINSKQDVLFLVCTHLVKLYQSAFDESLIKSEDSHIRLVEALRAIINVMSLHRDEVQLLYNETHALDKSDRKIILTSIAKLIKGFQMLFNRYVSDAGPCLIKNDRIADNLLSFVPAMLALRSWDLSAHADREEIELTILSFTLSGLGIPLKTLSQIEPVGVNSSGFVG
jgi:AcrR family transcriptional regulator